MKLKPGDLAIGLIGLSIMTSLAGMCGWVLEWWSVEIPMIISVIWLLVLGVVTAFDFVLPNPTIETLELGRVGDVNYTENLVNLKLVDGEKLAIEGHPNIQYGAVVVLLKPKRGAVVVNVGGKRSAYRLRAHYGLSEEAQSFIVTRGVAFSDNKQQI